LPRPDSGGCSFIDASMDTFVEVFRLEKVRNPVARLVIDQNGTQKRLFCFQVVRSKAIVFAAISVTGFRM
jgi:ribosomal protein L16/L10AE